MNKQKFLEQIAAACAENPKIKILHADHNMFDAIETARPGTVYDVGISEQAMVSMAAGLASTEYTVVVCARTPFLVERALEQIKLDVVEKGRPVIIVGDTSRREWGTSHDYNLDLYDFGWMLEIVDSFGVALTRIGPCFLEIK